MLSVHNGVIEACGGAGLVLHGAARARARSALHDVLLGAAVFDTPAATTQYTVELEACAAAYALHDYAAYIGTMARITFNLQHNGPHIVATYPLSQVCRLSHKRLRAETENAQKDAAVTGRLQALMARAEAEAAKATAMASSVQNATMIRCPKCKTTDNITRVLAQLRSGDEGMSTRCLCRCGATWKLAS